MRPAHLIAAALLVAAALTAGCQRGAITADAIAPSVQAITERHDTYVANDAGLSDAEHRAFLRESAVLRQLVEEAQGD